MFLWAHDYARPVIGRAVEVWQEPHRLLAKMNFAPTEFAQEVAMLYRTGYQKGVSVGFKPLRYEERRDEKTGAFLGIRFLEQELLETSAVPVPANRNALRRALDQAPVVGEYLRLVDAIGNAAEAPSSNINRAAVCVHEGIWPELAARVDGISKLIGELAQMLEEADQFGEPGEAMGQLDQVLSLIRQARA